MLLTNWCKLKYCNEENSYIMYEKTLATIIPFPSIHRPEILTKLNSCDKSTKRRALLSMYLSAPILSTRTSSRFWSISCRTPPAPSKLLLFWSIFSSALAASKMWLKNDSWVYRAPSVYYRRKERGKKRESQYLCTDFNALKREFQPIRITISHLVVHAAAASLDKAATSSNTDHACPVPASLVVADHPGLVIFLNILADRVRQLDPCRGWLRHSFAFWALETKVRHLVLHDFAI